jgi:hypothetical protein
MRIVSIKYDKCCGEYEIKTRDTKTGKLSVMFANHLNDTEIAFTLHALTHENNDFLIWVE